jgi:hypothetical protein
MTILLKHIDITAVIRYSISNAYSPTEISRHEKTVGFSDLCFLARHDERRHGALPDDTESLCSDERHSCGAFGPIQSLGNSHVLQDVILPVRGSCAFFDAAPGPSCRLGTFPRAIRDTGSSSVGLLRQGCRISTSRSCCRHFDPAGLSGWTPISSIHHSIVEEKTTCTRAEVATPALRHCPYSVIRIP